jgi:ZIP Zinc transporter
MTTSPLTAEPDVSPLADRPVDRAAARAVTDPTVISPLKNERPETWTEAVAAVVLPAEPVTDDETDAALAIDPSPGNARLPLVDAFGGAVTPPAEALPMPGADTEIPKASALGAPAAVADGAPAEPDEPVSAKNASRPSRSEFLLTTAPDYWPQPRCLPAVYLHHRDEPEQARAHGEVGALGAGALACHPFTDGLGIGLAFGLNTETGILVLIAVVSHDFADGINAVTFVLGQGGTRRSALRWLVLVAVAPLFGALVGTAVDISERTLGHLLAVYAGIFLYIGATDLLPEAHSHPSGRRIAVTIAGFAGVFLIASLVQS